MFNDEAYIKELTGYINKLDIDSVLEVGCRTGELLEGLTAKEKVGIDPTPERGNAIVTTLENYKPGRKFDLVFSSGVMEHFDRDYVVELLKKQAGLSNKYVLTLVPNAACNAYNRVKHCFEPEDSYACPELIEQYKKAGIEVVDHGNMAFDWCVNRFGAIPNQGYLSYVLGAVE
jgi:SAM-dependent methyltransferase